VVRVLAHDAGALHADFGHPAPAWLRGPADVNALVPQLWPAIVTRGPDGRAHDRRVPVTALAPVHGTPAYLLDEADLRARCRDFVRIRTALSGACYSSTLASRASRSRPALVRVVGKHREAGDVVVADEFLPAEVRPGSDVVAVPGTGAYCRSMASNYNHLPRPPVVAVAGGRSRVVVRRETEADLPALDLPDLDLPDLDLPDLDVG
jgi:hypothetical protein